MNGEKFTVLLEEGDKEVKRRRKKVGLRIKAFGESKKQRCVQDGWVGGWWWWWWWGYIKNKINLKSFGDKCKQLTPQKPRQCSR